MSRQTAALLNRLGIQPSPVLNPNINLPAVRTREELEAFGQQAINKMHDSNGRDSADYIRWQHMLAAGLDETLPDATAMQGGILKSEAQLAQEVANHADSSAHYITKPHPMIAEAGWQGAKYEDVKQALMLKMAEASTKQERNILLQLNSALEDSGRSSMTGISWEMPEQPVNSLTYEMNLSDGEATPSREAILDEMSIKPSVSNDPIWSGITDWNGSGGTYEVWSDMNLQAQQSQANDFHQGDAGANTQAPL